jgi:hypothetical protein
MRPAVEGKAKGGMSIPVRWSHAPSSTGLDRSGGNGKSVGFDISLPVDQEGLVEELSPLSTPKRKFDLPPLGARSAHRAPAPCASISREISLPRAGTMGKQRRDDFPVAVKRATALRVNNRCSNPTCGASTSGPQSGLEKVLNIGVAAHVTAASSGGPRYDSAISEAERKSATNAIWLCQNCAKLIDNDSRHFSAALLRHWKEIAEAYARERIGKQSPFERSAAPHFRVFKGEAYPVLKPPEALELSSEELIGKLRTLLPTDLLTCEEFELLDRGRGALGQPYAVLAAGKKYGWDWDVIFFSAGEFGWEVIARTSLTMQKGHVPSVLYIAGTPGALVLTHVAGWGTGVFRRRTSWYRIAKGEPIPLLSYPHDFYVVGWGMPFDRRLKSRLVTVPPILQTGTLLELDFTIDYTITEQFASDRGDPTLISSEERLSLEWNESASAFVPRTSSDDFAKIEELWNEGTDGFVRRNLVRLRYLANYGTYRQRSFIQRHLLRETPTAD